MTRARSIITSFFFSLSVLALSPASLPTQAFADDTYKADAAILSAGSRAAAISRLKSVPSVGVVNLNIRYVSRFRDDAHDVAAFKISAGKNFSGIRRLRAALAANPATRRALSVRGISVNRVVGVDIYSNGSIRLYTL
jgi:hypothetical protein